MFTLWSILFSNAAMFIDNMTKGRENNVCTLIWTISSTAYMYRFFMQKCFIFTYPGGNIIKSLMADKNYNR